MAGLFRGGTLYPVNSRLITTSTSILKKKYLERIQPRIFLKIRKYIFKNFDIKSEFYSNKKYVSSELSKSSFEIIIQIVAN